jgi:hypothetical protein
MARRAVTARTRSAHTGGMPNPRRIRLGEALISTALLSLYLGCRGTALAIAAAQTSPSLCGSAPASVRGRTSRPQRMRATRTPEVHAPM